MTNIIPLDLERAVHIFNNVRQNLYIGAELLYRIKSEELWKGHFDSFAQFVEQECRISLSMASKLTSVYEGYVINGGIDKKQLEGTDHEKAYLALKLEGTPQKQLAQAKNLTRQELKQIFLNPHDDCLHQETITICAHCHKRV